MLFRRKPTKITIFSSAVLADENMVLFSSASKADENRSRIFIGPWPTKLLVLFSSAMTLADELYLANEKQTILV
jgi:hypothetical protein